MDVRYKPTRSIVVIVLVAIRLAAPHLNTDEGLLHKQFDGLEDVMSAYTRLLH